MEKQKDELINKINLRLKRIRKTNAFVVSKLDVQFERGVQSIDPPDVSTNLDSGSDVGMGEFLDRLLGDGWHPSDDWGVWSNTEVSSVWLPISPELVWARVEVDLIGYVPHTGLDQVVIVLLDSERSGHLVFTEPEAQKTFVCNTFAEQRIEGRWIKFTFLSLAIRTPSDFGSVDARRLGVALRAVRVR